MYTSRPLLTTSEVFLSHTVAHQFFPHAKSGDTSSESTTALKFDLRRIAPNQNPEEEYYMPFKCHMSAECPCEHDISENVTQ